jgi:hypothetical protein
MTDRETTEVDRAGKLERIETKRHLRQVAAELASDVTALQGARGRRRRDGAVDPAHRLLVGTLPQE